MKKINIVLIGGLLGLTGCLTSTAPSVSQWNLEYTSSGSPSARAVSAPGGVARIMQMVVRAPYNEVGIGVLRANGSIAFDPFNEYAVTPSQLLKGVTFDALLKSGLFKDVVGAGSLAAASVDVEVIVSRLALDCRVEGQRRAVAEVCLRLLTERRITAFVIGRGSADAADGNYGAALSKAVSEAFDEALEMLRK